MNPRPLHVRLGEASRKISGVLLSHVAECGSWGPGHSCAGADRHQNVTQCSEDRATTQEWKERVRGWER